jgi:hypothetical protein
MSLYVFHSHFPLGLFTLQEGYKGSNLRGRDRKNRRLGTDKPLNLGNQFSGTPMTQAKTDLVHRTRKRPFAASMGAEQNAEAAPPAFRRRSPPLDATGSQQDVSASSPSVKTPGGRKLTPKDMMEFLQGFTQTPTDISITYHDGAQVPSIVCEGSRTSVADPASDSQNSASQSTGGLGPESGRSSGYRTETQASAAGK